MASSNKLVARRKQRTRIKIKRNGGIRPRLSIHRSGNHIYAQIIDDVAGKTLAAASSLEKDQRKALKGGATIDSATAIGKLIAERATAQGVKDVVFDRGSFRYHGRVKALADAARESGLSF